MNTSPRKHKSTKARPLTRKQRGFCKSYMESGNRTKATLENYETADYATARSIGSENLTKPNIQEWLRDKATEAISRIEVLSRTAKSESVRLNANKDIADRGGLKSTDKTGHSTFDLSNLLDQLDAEKRFGVVVLPKKDINTDST